MPAGLLSTIAGLGGLASGYSQGQDQALQRALLMQKLQEQQKQDQLKQQLAAALFSGGGQPLAPVGGGMSQPPGAGMPGAGGSAGFGSGMPGGGLPQAPQQQQMPQQQQPNNQATQIAALTQAMGGGGQSPQMRPPQAMGGGMMGQIPGRGTPQREGLVDLLIRDESGGRNINQQVVGPSGGYNPSTGGITGPSSASGLGQMIDSTWRGTPTAQKTGYSRAIDAPAEVQKEAINDQIDKRGLADWAPYNKKFASDAKAYLGGLDLPAGGAQQAQTASNQIMNTTPMSAAGSTTLDSLVNSINQRMPNASPEVKLAAMQMLTPLMTEQAKTEWDHYKFFATQGEKQQEFKERQADRQITHESTQAYRDATLGKGGQVFQDQTSKKWYRMDPQGNVSDVALPAGATKPGTPSQGAVSPEAQNLVAEGIANYQLPPLTSWALKSPNGQATMAQVMKLNPKYDATKFTGKQSGERAMGTRSAQLTMATDVAEEQIPLVQATSDRIDRTQYPTMNAAILALEKGTGGEDIVRFMEQINTLKYVYARALNPTGVARIEDLNRFDNIINEAWSKGQIRAALDQMRQSLAAERRGVDRAMGGNKEPAASNAPPAQQSGQQGQYNTPDDVMRAVDAGTLDEEAAKKIMIEKFGYTQE